MTKPKKKGDSPPHSPTPEEVQYQRDLQIAIQRPIGDGCGTSYQPTPSTGEVNGSSSEDEGEENMAGDDIQKVTHNQPNDQKESQALERVDGQEVGSSSGNCSKGHDSMTGSFSEDETKENTVDNNSNVIVNQPNDQNESQALEGEDGQEEESSSEDSGNEYESIPDSPSEDETEENMSDYNTENVIDNQPCDQKEMEALKGDDDQQEESSSEESVEYDSLNSISSEEESEEYVSDDQSDYKKESQAVKPDHKGETSSEDSDKDYNSGTEIPPDSLMPEDEQFERDLAIAIQRSIEDAYALKKKSASSVSELTPSSSEDDSKEYAANDQENEEKSQAPKREDNEEEEYSSEVSDLDHDSLCDSLSEDERKENNTVDAIDNQTKVKKKSHAPKQESDQEEETSSEDSGREYDSLSDSFSDVDNDENVADDGAVNAVYKKANVQEQSLALIHGVQEEESASGCSDKECDSPKEEETDYPLGSLMPEEVQFQRDLMTAIQRSIEDTRRLSKQLDAAIRESENSENRHPPNTGKSSVTLTADSSEDESEENAAAYNTVNAVDNKPSVQEESQALGQDVQEEESAAEDSGTDHDSNLKWNRQRSSSPTLKFTINTEKITAQHPIYVKIPREIDLEGPRHPVGKGAVKKVFRQQIESRITPSSQSTTDTAADGTRGLWRQDNDVPLGVWQYPFPKRPSYPDEEILMEETRNALKSETISEAEVTDEDMKFDFQQKLEGQQEPDSDNHLRKRWSKPYPISDDNIAYLERQKIMSEENEKGKAHSRNIFQELRRWEFMEYMEATKRPFTRRFHRSTSTKDNSQLILNNDKQQPSASKESNERGNLRYSQRRPVFRGTHKPIDWKVAPITDQEKKTTINTEQPTKITANEECKKDEEGPQRATRPVIVSAVLKKKQPLAQDIPKEMPTVEEQNKHSEFLLRDIVRIFFEKKLPDSADCPDNNVPQKNGEPQIGKGTTLPLLKKEQNCTRNKVSNIPVPIKATGIQIKSGGKETIPEEELKIREMTKKLLEDIKDLDLNETLKCNIEEGLEKMHEDQLEDNISKHEKHQSSDNKMVRDEQMLFEPNDSDSLEMGNKFNELLQICVDEKEMCERHLEAAGKISSDRRRKMRYIRRRARRMEKRNFMMSTGYHADSDACLQSSTANQEHQVRVDEIQHSYVGANIKSHIQSNQRAFSKEQHVEAKQASQYLHGQRVQQKPPKSTMTENELAKTDLKEKDYKNKLQSQQMIGNDTENITGHAYLSPINMNITEAHYEEPGSKLNQNQVDFLKMIPTFYRNESASSDTVRQNVGAVKEGCASLDNMPPTGIDIEDQSYLDELTDSFDITKQDIRVIQEDIRRRAQIYGYTRRRRRMATRKVHRSVDKQQSIQADDKKGITQPKTGFLRRLPSLSWRGQLKRTKSCDDICKLMTEDRWSSTQADSTEQLDEPSVSEQKFSQSLSGKLARWCSCHDKTNLRSDQDLLLPQVQSPRDLNLPRDRDEGEKVHVQQPVAPVINAIANGDKSCPESLQEFENDIKNDQTNQTRWFEVTHEQRNVMQSAIRNYLRTFGIPVHRVTSVAFMYDDSFVDDKDSAHGEHDLVEEKYSDESSEHNDNPPSTDDDSDDETDEDPGNDVDR